MDYQDPLDVQLDLKDVVKIRPRRKAGNRDVAKTVEEQGADRLAEIADPEELRNVEASVVNFSEDLAKMFGDNPEENAKKLYQVDWGDFDIEKIISALVVIAEKLSDMKSLPYQLPFERRLYRSILTNSSYTITYRVSRQAGKTSVIAKAINALAIVLPSLAKVFPEKLGMYKKGFWVGIFAPVAEQATTLYDRVKTIALSQEAQEIYEDPDIDTDINRKGGCRWDNGSRVYMRTASPKAKIESLTLHVAFLDEAQDADESVVNKSIKPMLAWNNGLLVMSGTSSREAGILYKQMQKNLHLNMILPQKEQLHFQYIDDDVIKSNPRYKLHCDTQKAEMGEDSPEYQMSYKLRWLFESDKPFSEENLKIHMMRYDRPFVRKTDRPVVIGIDLASKRMSSVATAIEIMNVTSVDTTDELSRSICSAGVCDWLEIKETPHPQQRPALKSFIDRYENIAAIVVDATGAGDPIYQQFVEEWPEYEGLIIPFIFHSKSKADLAKNFDNYYYSDRILIPCDKDARKTKKWQNFYLQFLYLNTVVKDGYSYYARNEKNNSSRDDYCDSLMLGLYGVQYVLNNAANTYVPEQSDNPYYVKTRPNKNTQFSTSNWVDRIREQVRNAQQEPKTRSARRAAKIYRK